MDLVHFLNGLGYLGLCRQGHCKPIITRVLYVLLLLDPLSNPIEVLIP